MFDPFHLFPVQLINMFFNEQMLITQTPWNKRRQHRIQQQVNLRNP